MVPCFSSTEELQPILDKGILVTFSDKPNIFSVFSVINTVRKFEDYPRFRTWIGTALKHFEGPTSGVRSSDLLEAQKVTLIHELLHVFHYCTTGQSFGRGRGAFGLNNKEYEAAIDEEAFRIVRQNSPFFAAVILELTVHQKCSWKYEVINTPFCHFHRDLILSKLQAERLKFGDPTQIRMLNLLREI